MKQKIILVGLIIFILFSSTVLAEEKENSFIIINKSTNQLGYFVGNELVKVFPVATGKTPDLTPEGSFSIVAKFKNPYYSAGNIPGGDPSNPLGVRWMGLSVGNTGGSKYGIHGNSNPKSIGTYASAGCIRMYNKDVTWLYDQIPYGTKVYITRSSKKFLALANGYGYNITASAVATELPQLPDIRVTLDYQPLIVLNGNQYYKKDEQWMVPLKTLVESLDTPITWQPEKNAILIDNTTQQTLLRIQRKEVVINNKIEYLNTAPKIRNGHTYVSLLDLQTILSHFQIHFDQTNNNINIYSNKDILLDDQYISLEKPFHLYKKENEWMVPVRQISERLNLKLNWDAEDNQLTLISNNNMLKVKPNEKMILLNNEAIEIPIEAEVKEGSMYLPLNTLKILIDKK